MASNDQKQQARAKREQAQQAAASAQRRQRNLQILAGLVFAAVVVVLIAVIALGGTGSKNETDAKGAVEGKAETVSLLKGLPQDGLTLGDPKAPATIIEFIDLQCPFCRDHQLDEQPAVIAELVRTGKAKILMQPLAFLGEDSIRGRNVLLRLAESDKAWNFTNLFYFNQGTENSGYATDAYLKGLVAAIPGTTAKDASTGSTAATEAAATKIDDLGRELGASGTPAFYVGKTGDPLTGYQSVKFSGQDQIAAALKSAVEGL